MARFFVGGLSLAVSAPVTIMPLGDSITFGCGDGCEGSIGGAGSCGDQCASYDLIGWRGVPAAQSGFRAPLWRKLSPGSVTSPDWDFVGSHQNGPDDSDRDHEGIPGADIEEIWRTRDVWLPQNPDVILLHIGTNNMGKGLQQGVEALKHLKILLDVIFEGVPDVRLLLSTIIGSTAVYGGKQHLPFNEGIRDFVVTYAAAGRNIELVDMARESAIGEDGCNPEFCCSLPNFPAGIHPTGEGYPLMADVWYNHIVGKSANLTVV